MGGNATSAKADQKLCEVKPARSSFHSLDQSMDVSPQTTLSPREVKEAAALEKLRRGALKRAPPFVVLVGLPGSGKSTFGTALAAAGWDRVSQDEMGGKGARNAAGLYSKKGGRCVIDRCNVEADEREEWVALMHRPPPAQLACVFFDVDKDECVRRIVSRTDHPTIEAGNFRKAKGIVYGFAKRLVPPLKSEGFGTVHTVTTREECKLLLLKWGVASAELESAEVHDQGTADSMHQSK